MLKITNEKDLVEFFNKYKSPAKVEVVAVTSQKMNKKDVATKTEANPFTSISKITNFDRFCGNYRYWLTQKGMKQIRKYYERKANA